MADQKDKLPEWAARIKKVREQRQMTQAAFAAELEMSQVTVSLWEQGKHKPVPDAFVRLAQVSPVEHKFFFLEQAGLPPSYFTDRNFRESMPTPLVGAIEDLADVAFWGPRGHTDEYVPTEGRMLRVRLLADAAAAGNPLQINEADIAETFWLPVAWFNDGANIYGVRVKGHSMHPVLNEGDIALVDVRNRSHRALVNHIVAVRVDDGVTIKYLGCRANKWFLVPANTSPEYEVRELGRRDDWAIVGEVVSWFGKPTPRKNEYI